MSPREFSLDYELHMLSAFHIGTGQGLPGVVDARTTRDERDAVYVPGASIKGRARDALDQMSHALGISHDSSVCRSGPPCSLCALFGSPAHSGALAFGDATQQNLWEPELRPYFESEARPGVMLSRRRGVALEKHLFATEVGAANLRLAGQIHGWLAEHGRKLLVPTAKEAVPRDAALLVAALRSLTHIGGRKSRGLGRCRVHIRTVRLDADTINADDLLSALLPEA